MNQPSKKNAKKRAKDQRGKSDSSSEAAENDKPEEKRDPAEVRAEKYRIEGMRETVEAFVVAFILALLFRAFLAEAFVIPTGSMAPTLMGAHKDVFCDRCNQRFQCGASIERSEDGVVDTVVATICPNCRHINNLDLAGHPDHETFNGDRILVSKFSYAFKDPQRWDVIVFKYPGNPKQNYIKRLVGLPNETLTIRHGDVFARPTGQDANTSQILRKPADTLLAMRHLVYNSDQQSETLISSGFPCRWQPWRPGATEPPPSSWSIQRSTDGLSASVDTSDDELKWLRYYHRWPNPEQWEAADQGMSLAHVNPYSSRLISDFYSYNAYIKVGWPNVYDDAPVAVGGLGISIPGLSRDTGGTFNPSYESGGSLDQFAGRWKYGRYNVANDGLHWVGDLILEADVETDSACKEAVFELVESGVMYQCRVDLSDGTATLQLVDTEARAFDGGKTEAKASTSLRAGSRHEIRFSNCDDQLLLWVDGDLVEFDSPTTFDSRVFRPDDENTPRFDLNHPLDAAPVGVAVRGGKATIRRLQIDRDKYYIAVKTSGLNPLSDYDFAKWRRLTGTSGSPAMIQQLFGSPELWPETGWQARRTVEFTLQDQQYFPMGDNSPESLDARCWANVKLPLYLPREVNKLAYQWNDASYVPRELMVGKALVVFWPHSWWRPVPFTPNVKRMKVIH